MRKRYILTDRAGNQLPDSFDYWTQSGAVFASRRHAPCWIIEEKAKPDYTGWCYSRDIGFRDDQLNYTPSFFAEEKK
jgi:hypothetical protein